METRYDGPEIITTLEPGGCRVALVRPAEPDRLLEAPEVLDWNRRDDYMPYWAYLWPGAYLLAEAVAREPWPEGGEALEIGCGLGLAGLVGLRRGLRVQFSDYDPAPLRFIVRSAERNGLDRSQYKTRLLDWRYLPNERFPIILGADVLYERRLVPLVVGLLDRMLAPGGLGLIAGPYRVATEDFEPALGAAGLIYQSESITAITESGEPVRGTLHRVFRAD
jgi:predicted nicotinamide N-methyase